MEILLRNEPAVTPKNAPIDRIMPAFFAAMLHGYASSDGEVKEVAGLFHRFSKITVFNGDEHGFEGFKVIDLWEATPFCDFSFGTTRVIYKGTPVWIMQYQGYYEKDVIPFLKLALATSYSKSEFTGGRGPMFFEVGENDSPYFGLRYVNHFQTVGQVQDWKKFDGEEEILRKSSTGGPVVRAGYHKYSGLLLLH
ncbi:MAG: hypothetical protein NTV72_00785 [Candidatus Taylorbacteria bacterium]|nr:hypothetical protein [Candidatus Taylorbacteria bacterium]